MLLTDQNIVSVNLCALWAADVLAEDQCQAYHATASLQTTQHAMRQLHVLRRERLTRRLDIEVYVLTIQPYSVSISHQGNTYSNNALLY